MKHFDFSLSKLIFKHIYFIKSFPFWLELITLHRGTLQLFSIGWKHGKHCVVFGTEEIVEKPKARALTAFPTAFPPRGGGAKCPHNKKKKKKQELSNPAPRSRYPAPKHPTLNGKPLGPKHFTVKSSDNENSHSPELYLT